MSSLRNTPRRLSSLSSEIPKPETRGRVAKSRSASATPSIIPLSRELQTAWPFPNIPSFGNSRHAAHEGIAMSKRDCIAGMRGDWFGRGGVNGVKGWRRNGTEGFAFICTTMAELSSRYRWNPGITTRGPDGCDSRRGSFVFVDRSPRDVRAARICRVRFLLPLSLGRRLPFFIAGGIKRWDDGI